MLSTQLCYRASCTTCVIDNMCSQPQACWRKHAANMLTLPRTPRKHIPLWTPLNTPRFIARLNTSPWMPQPLYLSWIQICIHGCHYVYHSQVKCRRLLARRCERERLLLQSTVLLLQCRRCCCCCCYRPQSPQLPLQCCCYRATAATAATATERT